MFARNRVTQGPRTRQRRQVSVITLESSRLLMRPQRLCRLESDTVGRTCQKDRLAHCLHSSHCSADKSTASLVRNDVHWITTRELSAYGLSW